MKLNKNQIQKLIKAIELFEIAFLRTKDKYSRQYEIGKYTAKIYKITDDINQSVAIINTCVLGDVDKILWKLRSNLN